MKLRLNLTPDCIRPCNTTLQAVPAAPDPNRAQDPKKRTIMIPSKPNCTPTISSGKRIIISPGWDTSSFYGKFPFVEYTNPDVARPHVFEAQARKGHATPQPYVAGALLAICKAPESVRLPRGLDAARRCKRLSYHDWRMSYEGTSVYYRENPLRKRFSGSESAECNARLRARACTEKDNRLWPR